MSVTPEITAEIIRLYESNPKRFSPFKVARQVGVGVSELLAVIDKHKNIEAPRGESLERPELSRYVVATRRADGRGWDNDDPAIAEARERYEAGTHDMATHRAGPWLHLCSIPRQRGRQPRPGFFSGKWVA